MSAPWQSINCFKRRFWTVTREGSQRERDRDGEVPNRQSENSGRSSFHPFVCLQAVFSPEKTKFNLHPFTHTFFLPSLYYPTLLPPLSSPSNLPFLFSHSPSFFLLDQSRQQLTPQAKLFESALLGTSAFKSVITSAIVFLPKEMGFALR